MSTNSSMNIEPALASFHETSCAALALNNHGASLLERGHFLDAIKTLKESIGVIKHTIVAADPSRSLQNHKSHVVGVHGLTVFSVNETLHSATIRLKSCKELTAPPLPSFFDIVAVDENDIAQISASLHSGLASSLSISVRMRDSRQVEQKSEIPYATILYNHGIAHLLAYEQKLLFGEGIMDGGNNNNTRYYQGQPRKHLEKALRSLSLAHSMLDQYRSQCNDACCMMQAMLLSALVLRKLIRVLIYMTKPKEAQQVLMTFSQLDIDIRAIQDAMRSMNVEMDSQSIASAA